MAINTRIQFCYMNLMRLYKTNNLNIQKLLIRLVLSDVLNSLSIKTTQYQIKVTTQIQTELACEIYQDLNKLKLLFFLCLRNQFKLGKGQNITIKIGGNGDSGHSRISARQVDQSLLNTLTNDSIQVAITTTFTDGQVKKYSEHGFNLKKLQQA